MGGYGLSVGEKWGSLYGACRWPAGNVSRIALGEFVGQKCSNTFVHGHAAEDRPLQQQVRVNKGEVVET